MSTHSPSPDRQAAARHSTLVSVVVNVALTLLQFVVGWWAQSQALIADSLHSLSDLVADFVVLLANRHSHAPADSRHPYGHARFENAASLVIGVLLLIVGIGMIGSAASKLQHPETLSAVHVAALWTAGVALVAKESLFRYMLAVAQRVRSSMLVANAWHARSDAASSLVVGIGVAGNLLGYHFLDALAAALVGFLITKMGWEFGYSALKDLMDESLDEQTVLAIRQTLLATTGVKDIHELRTRKMGDFAVIDAHLLVNPQISVSEGHYIAEQARKNVLAHHHALDVLVHIDPEDDAKASRNGELPARTALLHHLDNHLSSELPRPQRTVLHYLDGQIEMELFLSGTLSVNTLQQLQTELLTLEQAHPQIRRIYLHHTHSSY